mmetsp:Transcript_22209/g.30290  ORF Transcript_22209/g.30290 Transcript_22209/m.30290 type:complete len:299 (-) Transcript_22209:412-1308(-)
MSKGLWKHAANKAVNFPCSLKTTRLGVGIRDPPNLFQSTRCASNACTPGKFTTPLSLSIDQGAAVDPREIHFSLVALCLSQRLDDASAILASLLNSPLTDRSSPYLLAATSTVLDQCLEQGDTTAAMCFYRNAVSLGLVLDVPIHNALIRKLAEQSGFPPPPVSIDHVLEIFSAMVRNRIPITSDALETVLHTLIPTSPEDALRVWEDATVDMGTTLPIGSLVEINDVVANALKAYSGEDPKGDELVMLEQLRDKLDDILRALMDDVRGEMGAISFAFEFDDDDRDDEDDSGGEGNEG